MAVNLAAADAAAGEEHGVAVRPVLAAAVAARDLRRSAELGGHHHQRLVQLAALVQVGHQGVEGPIERRHQVVLVGGEVVPVRVPGEAVLALRPLPVALHQPRAGVEQPPAQQHRLAEQIAAVAFALALASRPDRSTALRTASDEITSSALAWLSRMDWVMASSFSCCVWRVELIEQGQRGA